MSSLVLAALSGGWVMPPPSIRDVVWPSSRAEVVSPAFSDERDRAVEWLSANWLWILIAVAFLALHLFGHGGHGGHGGDDGSAGHRH